MRTTLSLEDDALALARAFARRRGSTLGQAVSELVRLGARRPLPARDRNGLLVVQLPAESPRVTSDRVARLLDELL